ncbi:MAG: ERF family protein [Patescibacteria group bacterium]
MSEQKQISIYKKIGKIQREIGIIKKDAKGFNYTYASYDSIIRELLPHLLKNNLTFVFVFDGDVIKLKIIDTDSSEIEESSLNMKHDSTQVKLSVYQQQGSAITYYKRYMISALFGLVTDEDNDASKHLIATDEQVEKILAFDKDSIQRIITNQSFINAQKNNVHLTNEQIEKLKNYGKQ